MRKRKKGNFLYGFWNSIFVFLSLGVLVLFFVWIIGSGTLERNRYPLKYSEFVDKYCDIYGVDRCLVYSVIRTESFFSEDAVSAKGAVGLMQIMPDTALWVAEKLNLEKFSDKDLFEPEKNIMIGVWYLNYLFEKFDGNIDNVIVAYNAGPSNVLKWLNNKEFCLDGENLNSIPFKETREYRKKVSSAYDMYLRLYGVI